VTQSGNALAVRIAKKVAEFVSLKKGEEVSVHPEGRKRLVIEAV
jgi:antitoxin component of MazEF toxin-antitoxin module